MPADASSASEQAEGDASDEEQMLQRMLRSHAGSRGAQKPRARARHKGGGVEEGGECEQDTDGAELAARLNLDDQVLADMHVRILGCGSSVHLWPCASFFVLDASRGVSMLAGST